MAETPVGVDLIVSTAMYTGVGTYPPGTELGPRMLRDYEFMWMIEGDAVYRRGDRTFSAPRDSVVLCGPGVVEQFIWDRNSRTRHGYFHFEIKSVPRSWPLEEQWPVVRMLAEDDIIRPLFRHYLTWHDRQSEQQSILTIANILSVFINGNGSVDTLAGQPWPAAVETACAFISKKIEAEPSAVLSLRDLAEEVCVTPEHLCRLFRSTLGRTPSEMIRSTRLDHAAGLLVRSNYKISEISEIGGFASPFHFSRIFKSAFGQSPTDFRVAKAETYQFQFPRLREIVSK